MSIVFGLKNLGMMLIFFVEFYSEMCFFVCVFSYVLMFGDFCNSFVTCSVL